MPVIRTEGKDTIIFASKEDHSTPCKIELPEPEPSPGLLLPNGDINWNCPCLGGMATGPCGVEFREAFSCFHYSTADPKGSDCYESFKTMQHCMAQYPALYGNKEPDLDNLDDGELDDDRSEHSVTQKDTSLKNQENVGKEDRPSTPSNKQEVEVRDH